MSILIVDDSPPVLRLLQSILERAGHTETICADCGKDALRHLGLEPAASPRPDIDCILLDIVMPGMDGIEVCHRIKEHPDYKDTPVIMVTIKDEVETLRAAFTAGAQDYITKPVRELELVTRLNAAITLKKAIEARKEREKELLVATEKLVESNRMLEELSITDDLTKVGNSRYFAGCLENEWRHSFRYAAPLSVIFVALDRFQEFINLQGKGKSDQCLKAIAQVLQISLRRTTDILSRHGDSLFAILLPRTPLIGAQTVANLIKRSIDELQIKHRDGSPLTISQGVATVIPTGQLAVHNLVLMAEGALGTAQKAGGDQIVCADPGNRHCNG